MTKTTNQNSNILYPCEICKKEVKDADKGIECDCEKWYHIRCVGVTEKQYKNMIDGVNIFTWVCKNCYNSRPKLKPSLNSSKTEIAGPIQDIDKVNQLEKVLELLMLDINDFKDQLKREKETNQSLSETVVKKMEVIYKLEQTLHDLIKDSTQNTSHLETTTPTSGVKNFPEPDLKPEQLMPKPKDCSHVNRSRPTEPEALLIGDSTLRAAASMIKDNLNIKVETKLSLVQKLLISVDTLAKSTHYRQRYL